MKKKSFYCLWLALLCSFTLMLFGSCSTQTRVEATISNKEALTAEWFAEDDDRSMELKFNPDSYNEDNIETVVSSSNSNVIRASGTTLSAIGPGTATVSVAVAGTVTDSVEISVKPKETGIVIVNRDEITDMWIIGDADRTLELEKVYKKAESAPLTHKDVSVTSSNSAVVGVSGLTLKAKGVGKSTIRITSGSFETSVDITVRPTLQSFDISNKGTLSEVWCGVTYEMIPSFAPAADYTKDNTKPKVEFGTEGILRYEGGYTFKALKVGTTSVKVTVADKTVNFDAQVVIGKPSIEFESADNFNQTTCTYNVLLDAGETTKTFALPKATARSGEGNDITDRIKITSSVEVTDGNVTLGAGTHTFTYTVDDSRDTSKIDTKTLTVKVSASTFAINPTYSSTGVRAFTESVDANGNVTFTSERYGEVSATFNTEASTQYYAEATFNLVRRTDGSYPAFGLAHFKSVNPIVNETGDAYNDAGARFGRSGWLSVKSGSSATYLVGSVTAANDHWYDATEMYKNTKFRDNGTFSTMKIAIARSGSTVYTFVDGKLIHFGDIPWDDVTAGTQTTPGIIVSGSPNEFTASNITVLSGSNAETKINTVLSQTSVLGNNPTYRSNGLKTYYEYLGDDGGVRIQSGRYGELAATFNTQASTLYYAEATFPWLKQDANGGYTSFGLAHFKSLNTTVNETGDAFNEAGTRYGRDCVMSAKSGSSNTFIVGTLTASQQHWYDSTALHKDPNFAPKGTTMKIAIARTDTMMYTFVDDKLVYSCAVPAGYSAATTPGIITIGDSYSFVISKISVLSGAAAQAKIKELTTATTP